MQGMMVSLLVLLMTGTVIGQQNQTSPDARPGRLVLPLRDADLNLLRTTSQGLIAPIENAPVGTVNRVHLRHDDYRPIREQNEPLTLVWWLTDRDIELLKTQNLRNDIPAEMQGRIIQVMLEYSAPANSTSAPERDRIVSQQPLSGGSFGGGTSSVGSPNRFNPLGQSGVDGGTSIQQRWGVTSGINYFDENAPRRTDEPIWQPESQIADNRSQQGTLAPQGLSGPRFSEPPATQNPLYTPPNSNRVDPYANERIANEVQREQLLAEQRRQAREREAIADAKYWIEMEKKELLRQRESGLPFDSTTFNSDRFASTDSSIISTAPDNNRLITPSQTQVNITEYDGGSMPTRGTMPVRAQQDRLAQLPAPTPPSGMNEMGLMIPFPNQLADNRPIESQTPFAGNQTPSNSSNLGATGGNRLNSNQMNNGNPMNDANAQNEERSRALLLTMLLASIGLNFYLAWISRGFYVRYHELADELRETFTATM